MKPITLNKVDEELTSKMFGYKIAKDYHYKSACSHQISKIKVPTLFFNSLDDPMIVP